MPGTPCSSNHFSKARLCDLELMSWSLLFISPISTYRSKIGASYPPTTSLSTDVFDSALVERPTVLFFHGNVSSLATSFALPFLTSSD